MLAERCGQVLITKFDPTIFQSVVFHAFLRTTVDDVSICTFTSLFLLKYSIGICTSTNAFATFTLRI